MNKLTPPQRLVLNTTALVLALVWLALIGLTIAPDVSDFQDYWQGTTDLLHTGDPYTTQPGYIYPPLFVYLMLPFGWFPHDPGQQVWFGLNLLVLAGLIALCIRASGSLLARRYWGVVALGTALVPPTRLCLQLGQVGLLMALLLVGSFVLAPRRHALAGLLLATASMIKLQPALAGLHYLVRPPRRVAAWGVAMGFLLLLLTVLPVGTAHYTSYFSTVVQSGSYSYASEHTISLHAVGSRLFTHSRFVLPPLEMPILATVFSGLGSVVLLAVGVWVGSAPLNETGTFLMYSFWFCGMLLIWPANGYYNLTTLLLPVLAIVRFLEQSPDRSVRALLVIAIALVCIPPGWSNIHPVLYQTTHVGWGVLLLTPAFYGVLLLAGLLAVLVRRTIQTIHMTQTTSC